MKKCLILAATGLAGANALEANPVGQVLDLLQKLYDTVASDGEKEQKQFEKFADYCKDESRTKQFEIKTAKSQAADFKATIEKAGADIDALNSKVVDVSQSIAANEADLSSATDIRNNEHESFKKEEKELVDTVDTLRRARQVLSKHGLSLSQVKQTKALDDLTASLSVMLDAAIFSVQDKNSLRSFLQSQDNDAPISRPEIKAYESHSKGILDTLEDMQEKAEGLLADARKTEITARHNYELLAQSLKDELKVEKDALSNTKKQLASTSEVKSIAEGDLATTETDLKEDQAYLKDLSQNCSQRAIDQEISQKSRAEELKALAEAKKIIAEATGGASKRQYGLIQTGSKDTEAAYERISKNIKNLGKKDNNFALTQLASQIRAAVSMNADPFAKVKGLISDMISRLLVEAQEEASHKAFCDKETADNEAKRDKLQAESNKLSTRIEAKTAAVAKLKEQVAELHESLANIAKSQKNIDTMRQEEHEEYIKSKADFEQGIEGVRSALKILRDYYNQQGVSLAQQPSVSVHSKSGDSSTGIISILEVAESDFARSLAEAQQAEDEAQNVYSKTTQENKVATATKKTSVEGKTQEQARLESSIADASSDHQGVQEELSAVLEYLEKLRPQCTTEPESYEDRKARREHEIEGLKDALEILESETAFTQESMSFLSLRSRNHVTIQ